MARGSQLGMPPPENLWGPTVEATFLLAGVVSAYTSVQPLFDDEGNYREFHLTGGARILIPIPAPSIPASTWRPLVVTTPPMAPLPGSTFATASP